MNEGAAARLVLSCAALFACSYAWSAPGRPCDLKRYASIDLARRHNGYLLVPVQIQGSSAFMILNMTYAFSSLTEGAATRLGLQTRYIPFGLNVHAGSKELQKTVTSNQFSLGGVKYRSMQFLVLPNDSIASGTPDTPVVGVLGMDAFSQIDVDLDVANLKMGLFSPDHCPGHVVYWTSKYDSAPIRFGKLGEFYFPMELDGKKLETTLATGNSVTVLTTDATRKLYNFDSHSPDIDTETDSAGRTTAHYRAMKLSGEGLEIINARIQLIDLPEHTHCMLSSDRGAASYDGCLGMHPLELGLNVLSKLHIYIATREKMLYFTPAEAATTADSAH